MHTQVSHGVPKGKLCYVSTNKCCFINTAYEAFVICMEVVPTWIHNKIDAMCLVMLPKKSLFLEVFHSNFMNENDSSMERICFECSNDMLKRSYVRNWHVDNLTSLKSPINIPN